MKPTLFQILLLSAIFAVYTGYGQVRGDKQEDYRFTDLITIESSDVKDQHQTGTCWSFAGVSLLESEIIRQGGKPIELSPMFVVYHTYLQKADKFVRMHGKTNFSGGGAFHDVTNVVREYGIVPYEVYTGLHYGEEKHSHGELEGMLTAQVESVIKNTNRKLTPAWRESVQKSITSYLGAYPEKFEYNDETYTPVQFAREVVGLNMDDYVELTSFTHHPFYEKFILEIPDNWSWDAVYNLPLEELMEVIDYALVNGYSLGWAADVSERGFMSSHRGVAVIPARNTADMSDTELSRWEALTSRQQEDELYRQSGPLEEAVITQEMRQLAFDNFQTTDDHGMHIVGMARDQKGNCFYKIKNSWGSYNLYNGYFYASRPYMEYKTITFMLHKDGIPEYIRKKLDI